MPTLNKTGTRLALNYASAANHWPTPSYKVVEKWSGQLVYNAPQHRVRPVSLRENPTALTTQTRSLTSNYYEENYWCPANYGPGSYSQTSYYAPGYLPWMGSITPPTNLYVNRLRNQISDVQGVNIAEDCFEFRQTADLFTDLTKEVARGFRAYRALRRGDVLGARLLARKPLTAQSIAKAHLAASWGLAPLVSTFQEGTDRLNAELMNSSVYWKRFVALSTFENQLTASSPYEYLYRVRQTERAVLWVKFRPDGIRQVHMGNALSLGWNLLTLSCIADWFIPIGEALQALDALSGVERSIGTVTTKKREHWKIRRKPSLTVANGVAHLLKPITWQERIVDTHGRKVLASIPSATLPRWDPSLSWRKLSLAVAVLVGLRGGARTKPGSDPLKPIPTPEVRQLAKKAAKQRELALNGKRPRAERDIWEGRFD